MAPAEVQQGVNNISSDDFYLFGEGTHERAWDWLGAHPCEQEGAVGTRFTLWAPNAGGVAVVGDFNDWDSNRHPLRNLGDSGVWECFVPGVGDGQLYKFELTDKRGRQLPLKADPYAQHMEKPGETASIIHGEPAHDQARHSSIG